jgi:UDP-N-acetylglucosamine 2-epimerase
MIARSAPMRLLIIFGTRPEAIKLAPVIHAAMAEPQLWSVRICSTGQHDELLQQVLQVFDIAPHFDLAVMKERQSLAALTARLLEKLPAAIEQSHADVVIVQGDTTTAFAAALAAFYVHVPVAHIEAGLRTHDLTAPFPEELNRRLVAQMAAWHFAPTERARENLLREGVVPQRIHVVGNTIVDAVRLILDRTADSSAVHDVAAQRPFVLITHHRRESFGEAIGCVFTAIGELARRHSEIDFIFPVHPNPNVREAAERSLADLPNVRLIAPLPYAQFLALMSRSLLLITDSGGIQEEAAVLGKRVLVTREATERAEAIDAGVATLVGTDPERILSCAEALLRDAAAVPEALAPAIRNSPFGDGHAARRILAVLREEAAPQPAR